MRLLHVCLHRGIGAGRKRLLGHGLGIRFPFPGYAGPISLVSEHPHFLEDDQRGWRDDAFQIRVRVWWKVLSSRSIRNEQGDAGRTLYGRCRRATGVPTSVRSWPIADVPRGEPAPSMLMSASDPKRTFVNVHADDRSPHSSMATVNRWAHTAVGGRRACALPLVGIRHAIQSGAFRQIASYQPLDFCCGTGCYRGLVHQALQAALGETKLGISARLNTSPNVRFWLLAGVPPAGL